MTVVSVLLTVVLVLAVLMVLTVVLVLTVALTVLTVTDVYRWIAVPNSFTVLCRSFT